MRRVFSQGSTQRKKRSAVEFASLLTLSIVALFLFNVCFTFLSLPELPSASSWQEHIGESLNLANSEEWSARNLRRRYGDLSNGSSRIDVPDAQWPVSIRDEYGRFETILHPADDKTALQVPRFWSPPVHQNQLMTREIAMKIGCCVEPDTTTGSHARGDNCPLHQRTIYIAIASYRDYQCRETVESVFSRARHPERLRVGVVDQIVDGEDILCNEPIESCNQNSEQALCKYRDQVDIYTMDAQYSVGPVFARHIGYRMYRGEYYATQLDAHVSMAKDWDVDIIKQMEGTKNEMAVLSTYLSDVQDAMDEQGHSLKRTRPIMCYSYFHEGSQGGTYIYHSTQPSRKAAIKGSPQLQPWWAAGYSFARGHFIVNVPYDLYLPMIFQGEETSIAIRGFTIGYDFYAPEWSVCFHHYAKGENADKRNKVPSFWDSSEQYESVGKQAMKRLLGIVHMNPEVDPVKWNHRDENIYGLGGVRTPEKFYETYGIDVANKIFQRHLCRFVHNDGKMHHTFTPYLRKDGMGIDYDHIQYQFKDPAPDDDYKY